MDSPPPEGTIVKSRTETVKTEDDGSVITTTKTVYVTSVPTYVDTEITADTLKRISSREENLLEPTANRRSIINKEAYLKLHNINTSNSKHSLDNIKIKYENNSNQNNPEDPNNSNKSNNSNTTVALSEDSIQILKDKYSPSSFGYPKLEKSPELPKNPPPVIPRTSSLRTKPDVPNKPEYLRYSYVPYSHNKPEVPKRSSLLVAKAPRITDTPSIEVSEKLPPVPRLTESTLKKLKDTEVEERVIIRRSSSEDSVGKIESDLSKFTMETKPKKRSSSFKKILTNGLFGKDKKKSDKKKDEEKLKTKKTDNVIVADNAQNEQAFKVERQNSIKRAPLAQNESDLVEKQYAEMHINQFNRIRANFNQDIHNDNNQYREYNRNMQDKYLESSSSTNTLESEGTSSRQGTYQNALKAQAEMMQLRELELIANETPPRAKETHQNVQLIKPKALIPINSERALPNPYQNDEDLDNNLNRPDKDFDQSSYSPNVTKSSNSSNLNSPSSPGSYARSSTRSSPKSPTLEGSKLKLPQNREKISLQPRIKSPIPQNKISTDKIIATELLKKVDNKKTGPTHQKLEIEIDYPDHYENNKMGNKSPNTIEAGKWHQKQRELEKSPSLLGLDAKEIHVDVHKDGYQRKNHPQNLTQVSPKLPQNLPPNYQSLSQNYRGAVPQNYQSTLPQNYQSTLPQNLPQNYQTNLLQNPPPNYQSNLPQNPSPNYQSTLPQNPPPNLPPELPISPNNSNRSITPVRRAPSNASLQYSPSKQDMRQSVEIYCWKEIQKLKEKQDQELKYQLQYTPHGCVEDPIIHRRSRSVEPNQNRGRRSTSLPREVKPSQIERNNRYNQQFAIPENRPVYYTNDPIQNHPNFIRSSPQRRTVSGSDRRIGYEGYYSNAEVPYRPIFNRGSLNPHVQMEQYNINQINQQKKNVSFNGKSQQNQTQWPTKNGYVESPPQRRLLDKSMSIGSDDVFINNKPNQTQNDSVIILREPIYGTKPIQTTEIDGRLRIQEPNYAPRRQIQEESYHIRREIIENPYGQRIKQQINHQNSPLYALQENKHNLNEVSRQRQENISQNQIYGMQQVNQPIYASKLSIQESPYGTRESIYGSKTGLRQPINESPYGYRTNEPLYGQKQVTVSNKYCDIYGRIHDNGQRVPLSPPQGQQQGVIYGQLQGNVSGRPPLHHSYNQIPNNFVRGSRLTSSANDMYRRDLRVPPPGFNPNAPLPPIPMEHKTQILMRRRGPISDSESERNFVEEEWNADGKPGRGIPGSESAGGRGENDLESRSTRSRNPRRDDPRRHTLGGDQQYMGSQGGPLSRTMDLEMTSSRSRKGQPRCYPPPTNPMLFDDDPGIMSEVETSSTGFRRGGKQRSSLPVVRTPSKTLERPLGLVFLQYRNETKRALLPNEITSIDTVKALFVRSFQKQLTMEYLDSPQVKIYIHDSSKDMFYELEDLRSHLREIRDRSVLRLFESADVSGGLPMAGIGIAGGVGHFEDPSYFSEPEFDSEYQHQHIHKSKGSAGKAAPYYMGSTASLPRSGLLRAYSPAVTAIPPERLKPLPTGAPPKPQRAYSSSNRSSTDGGQRNRFAPNSSLYTIPDGYMSSPERGSRYEDPYYSQYSTRSGSITPVIDEEVSDTELLDESYSLYGVKLPTSGPRATPRTGFPPAGGVPYDATRIRVEHMERQLANLTGLVQKALTQAPPNLQVPSGRDNYRAGDEFDKNSTSSSTSCPDESFHRSDNKTPKLGKTGCHKSVSFEKSVSFSDEPPDMNSPKQHSPQHTERDRLKPAPPPKPASLSPGQYDGRHIYRDLQLTPEMYNQLRGLQKKAKDLRAEVRNLRRMSQAQAHSVRETIRDTFIKIRAMLLAGGEQIWQAGMDQERVRLSREEDLYKQEMLRLEKDLSELESTVEELRGNVINRKTRVNMSDVENMALILSKSSKTVADLKLRFPNLQDSMKSFLSSEMEKVVREEKFLKEEPERLESALRRCKKLTGTLVTLKRLASVQEQRLPCSTAPAGDGRLSPTISETPPITPTSAQHSKPTASPRMGSVVIGGDASNSTDGAQRSENALDALLDELQTFSKPHQSSTTVNTQVPQQTDQPPTLPAKGVHPPTMSEIGRKGSMDSSTILPTQNLTVSTATGSLRRLHSYPSGSDTDNSPPIQPLRIQDKPMSGKPPLPERNSELLQHISGKRVPPPPPPRTSSKSPLASPTSPSLPPRSNQHHQQQEKPQSQFETATQNLGLGTLRRNANRLPQNKNLDRSQTLPRNIGSNLQIQSSDTSDTNNTISASNSSSCESVNSQDGTKKRKEELEQRHQELLKKQKALQEQYARLQQLQRGNNTLAVVPPAPDQLLKKTGSESNLMQKMGLQLSAPQMTGSLTNLPNTTTSSTGKNETVSTANSTGDESTASSTSSATTTTTSKVYETDIL
nr:uncharacterized protein LOC111427760 isoform X5 [Onthophagus taurus]